MTFRTDIDPKATLLSTEPRDSSKSSNKFVENPIGVTETGIKGVRL